MCPKHQLKAKYAGRLGTAMRVRDVSPEKVKVGLKMALETKIKT